MKIRYENSLPLAAEYFGSFGEASGYDVGTLTPEQLVDFDETILLDNTSVEEREDAWQQHKFLPFQAHALCSFQLLIF